MEVTVRSINTTPKNRETRHYPKNTEYSTIIPESRETKKQSHLIDPYPRETSWGRGKNEKHVFSLFSLINPSRSLTQPARRTFPRVIWTAAGPPPPTAPAPTSARPRPTGRGWWGGRPGGHSTSACPSWGPSSCVGRPTTWSPSSSSSTMTRRWERERSPNCGVRPISRDGNVSGGRNLRECCG